MSIRPSRAVFAAAIIGLGIIGVVYGNAASVASPNIIKETDWWAQGLNIGLSFRW